MTNTVETFQAFGKEQIEASVASATAVTKGLQAIAAECADYSRKTFEQGAQTFEKVISANSIEKAFEIQQAYTRELYEGYLGQVNKLGELYMATAKEAYKPFESRLPLFNGPAKNR
ncbi:phasin family protein [Rhodoligotrophos defluvii]|uniref:phasin family protein n=1 Tax=Rhodoligotrophos defluvii TaxID=2561934 RepID=UPI0010C9859C|nr:phasin family protein [Rhodoligotrophos defluvii]